ncbi:hypothetical protein BDV06DRAFT_111915 [Aspergillus oleicola]
MTRHALCIPHLFFGGRSSCAVVFAPAMLIPRVVACDWIVWMATRRQRWRNISNSINASSMTLLAVVAVIAAVLDHIHVESSFARLVANWSSFIQFPAPCDRCLWKAQCYKHDYLLLRCLLWNIAELRG